MSWPRGLFPAFEERAGVGHVEDGEVEAAFGIAFLRLDQLRGDLFAGRSGAALHRGTEYLPRAVGAAWAFQAYCGALWLMNLLSSIRVIMFKDSNTPSHLWAEAVKVGICTSRLFNRNSRYSTGAALGRSRL